LADIAVNLQYSDN